MVQLGAPVHYYSRQGCPLVEIYHMPLALAPFVPVVQLQYMPKLQSQTLALPSCSVTNGCWVLFF